MTTSEIVLAVSVGLSLMIVAVVLVWAAVALTSVLGTWLDAELRLLWARRRSINAAAAWVALMNGDEHTRVRVASGDAKLKRVADNRATWDDGSATTLFPLTAHQWCEIFHDKMFVVERESEGA